MCSIDWVNVGICDIMLERLRDLLDPRINVTVAGIKRIHSQPQQVIVWNGVRLSIVDDTLQCSCFRGIVDRSVDVEGVQCIDCELGRLVDCTKGQQRQDNDHNQNHDNHLASNCI